MNSRNQRSTSPASATSKNIGPPYMSATGWSRNSRDVATPKFPPPPRSAQYRSSCSFALAVNVRPSAVTTSADTRLSHDRPAPRARYPMPPPRERPPTPVVEMMPPVVASPCAFVASLKSPHVAPPCARAVMAAGSTVTARIPERSITTPSSTVPKPGTLWPPPRTAIGTPCSRACVTAATTSSTVSARTTTAGRRSIIAL
jgi:hypothetical protein